MKKIFFTFIILIATQLAYSQLSVVEGSFKLLPNDQTAQFDQFKDDNNTECAALRIKTLYIDEEERKQLDFSSDGLTYFVERRYPVGEVLVWFTEGAKYIEFNHPKYSSSEKFYFPFPPEARRTYEITIEAKWNSDQKNKKPTLNYLIVTAQPAEAQIYINGDYISDGEASKALPINSEAEWRIEFGEMYHQQSGKVKITEGEPVSVNKTLLPAFGYMTVNSKPESGATVFIDGNRVGETPYRSDKLKSGTHKVKVLKEMYKPLENTFTVTDGNTVTADMTMLPNFSKLTLSTDAEADIYIDNDFKAKGRWTGCLGEGAHLVEARKASHETSSRSLNLVAGKDETIVIDSPTPIYGMLDINSSPLGATIYIDGKNCGTTPRILSEVLIGTRSLRLEKTGCAPLTKEITIERDKTLSLSEKLVTGKDIAISSEPSGASVYVDGTYAGLTPINISMSFGSHNVKVTKDGEEKTQSINVSEGGNSSLSFDVRKKPEIGSLYTFSDGSKGIVFYVGSDGHGLVVSLYQSYEKWNRYCTDISSIPDESSYNKTLKVGLGATYTTYIINQLGRGQAPAAEWCRSLGSEWYLPSAGELWQLLCVANGKNGSSGAISTAIKNNGGTALNGWYWSSSEYNYDYAWRLSDAGYTDDDRYKDHGDDVRAVRAF